MTHTGQGTKANLQLYVYILCLRAFLDTMKQFSGKFQNYGNFTFGQTNTAGKRGFLRVNVTPTVHTKQGDCPGLKEAKEATECNARGLLDPRQNHKDIYGGQLKKLEQDYISGDVIK